MFVPLAGRQLHIPTCYALPYSCVVNFIFQKVKIGLFILASLNDEAIHDKIYIPIQAIGLVLFRYFFLNTFYGVLVLLFPRNIHNANCLV